MSHHACTADPARPRIGSLALTLALLAGIVSVIGVAGPATPASAAASSVVSFKGQTIAITADGTPEGTLNRLRATMVVQHDVGKTVTAIRVKRNDPFVSEAYTSFTADAVQPGGRTTVATAGAIATSRTLGNFTVIEVSFEPGTGNWPSFNGGSTRVKDYNAYVQVQVTGGETLAANSWAYSVATTSATSHNEMPVPLSNVGDGYTTTENAILAPAATVTVGFRCADPDTDTCDAVRLQFRNLDSGVIIYPSCAAATKPSGDDCETRAGATNGYFNAGDGTQRAYQMAGPSTQGRWVIEGAFCNDDSACPSDPPPGYPNQYWLGSFFVNPSAPTVTLSGVSNTGKDAVRPHTGDTSVTYTAAVSADSQVLESDLDQNTSNGVNGYEAIQYGTPALTVGQLSSTVSLVGKNPGDSCGIRVRVTDTGASNAADKAALQATSTIACTINRVPVAADQTTMAAKGSASTITFSGTDGDGDALTCEIVSGPANGTISSGTGCSRTYTPSLFTPASSDTITYRVKDAYNGVSTTKTVTVNLTAVPGIRGRVTSDVSGGAVGVAGIRVRVWQPVLGFSATAFADTDASGYYVLPGTLPTSDFKLVFRDANQNYVDEWNGNSLTRSAAPTITRTATTESLLFASLATGSKVSGTVTPSTPVTVRLYDSNPVGSSPIRQVNFPTGTFEFKGLPSGTYFVAITDQAGTYVERWYDGKSLRSAATPIAVGTGSNVALAAQSLVKDRAVSGRVTDASNAGLANVAVTAYDASSGVILKTVKTDANGNYALAGLSGSVKLFARDPSGAYVGEWHLDASTLAAATAVAVPALGTVTVDFTLAATGSVSGVVEDLMTGLPVQGVKVWLYVDGKGIAYRTTGPDGSYAFTGLVPGSGYTTQYIAAGYRTEYHLDRSSKATADLFAVSAGTATVIDADLTPTT